MKPLIASLVSAATVAFAYGIIYCTGPKDPEYGGSGFSWLVTHLIPAALLAGITGIIAVIVCLVGIRKQPKGEFVRRQLPALLMLPFVVFTIHTGWIAVLLWTHIK